MDYEKKYNEALKWMRELYPGLHGATKEDAEHYFPELRESEDERVIRTLYYLVRDHDWLNGATKGEALTWLEKQKEQKPKHFELKAGKWYICHRAFCCRADHLTVKEGERFMCEKDGIVKGFVIEDPEKYFKECSAPAPMEDEQKPAEWSDEDEKMFASISDLLWEGYCCFKVNKMPAPEWRKIKSWLKSHLPSWKPSEEHLSAL